MAVQTADAVGGVEPMYIQEGVKVINICKLLDKLELNGWGVSWKVSSEAVRKWVKENDAHYYSACKEDFFIWAAVEDAIEAGKNIVVVENMS